MYKSGGGRFHPPEMSSFVRTRPQIISAARAAVSVKATRNVDAMGNGARLHFARHLVFRRALFAVSISVLVNFGMLISSLIPKSNF